MTKKIIEKLEGYVVNTDDSQIGVITRKKDSEGDYSGKVFVKEGLAQTFIEQSLNFLGAPFLLTVYSNGSYNLRLDESRDKPAQINKEISDLLDRLEVHEERLRKKLK